MSLTKVKNRMIGDAALNVVDYGADPTASSDSYAAFNAAITASGGTKAILIPNGNYRIDTALVASTRLILIGENFQRCQLDFANAGAVDCITVNGGDADGTYIEQILIKGSTTATSGIKLSQCHSFSVQHVKAEALPSGPVVYLDRSFTGTLKEVQCDNGYGIASFNKTGADGSNGVLVDHCFGTGLTGHGFEVKDSYSIAFNNCEAVTTDASYRALKIINTIASDTYSITVTNGIYSNSASGGTAIQIGDGVGNAVKNVDIRGAVITGSSGTSGISVRDGNGFSFGSNSFNGFTNAYKFETGMAGFQIGPGEQGNCTNFINVNGSIIGNDENVFAAPTANFTGLKGRFGVLDRSVSGATVHRELSGSFTSASAAVTDLVDITLSATDDDYISVEIDYVTATGPGGTISCIRGTKRYVAVQDSGNNRVLTAADVSETKALDAGMATFTTAASISNVANVVTCKFAQTNAVSASATTFFVARVMGSSRSSSAVLDSGVTVAS